MLDFLLRKKEDQTRIWQETKCKHQAQILTKVVCSNGAIQYVMQCEVCGHRCSPPIAHRKLSRIEKETSPLFNYSFQEEKDQVKSEVIRNKNTIHAEKFGSDVWWKEYNKYLESAEWNSKRTRILIRDDYKCTEKRRGCTHHATEVHHLTYRNVGNENLEDLTSLCHNCHEAITRESRIEWRAL